jgi:hypothetical protein
MPPRSNRRGPGRGGIRIQTRSTASGSTAIRALSCRTSPGGRVSRITRRRTRQQGSPLPNLADAYLSTSGCRHLAAIESVLCQTRYQVRFGHPRSPGPSYRAVTGGSASEDHGPPCHPDQFVVAPPPAISKAHVDSYMSTGQRPTVDGESGRLPGRSGEVTLMI